MICGYNIVQNTLVTMENVMLPWRKCRHSTSNDPNLFGNIGFTYLGIDLTCLNNFGRLDAPLSSWWYRWILCDRGVREIKWNNSKYVVNKIKLHIQIENKCTIDVSVMAYREEILIIQLHTKKRQDFNVPFGSLDFGRF